MIFTILRFSTIGGSNPGLVRHFFLEYPLFTSNLSCALVESVRTILDWTTLKVISAYDIKKRIYRKFFLYYTSNDRVPFNYERIELRVRIHQIFKFLNLIFLKLSSIYILLL